MRPAAAQSGRTSGRVFSQPFFSRVVNANNNQRRHLARVDQVIGRLPNVPIHAGDEGGCAIEKVLAVMQIKDRKCAARLVIVARREINDQVALVAQDSAKQTARA